MGEEPNPSGVVGLFIAPDGHVVAEVTDFERAGYGGFSLEEAQKIRCRKALNREIISMFSSPALSDHVSEYYAEGIVREMIERGGYRKHFVTIGHGAAEDGQP